MGHRLETSRRISEEKPCKLHDRSEFPFRQPYIDSRHEVRQRDVKEHLVQLKSSKKHLSKTGDELVRHMSNLPKYLQQEEHEKSIQGKALNFGVLDWKRLETWKLNEGMPPRSHQNSQSSREKDTQSQSLSQEEKILKSMRNAQGKPTRAKDFCTAPSSKDERKDSDKRMTSRKQDLFSDQFKNDKSKKKTDSDVNHPTQSCDFEPLNMDQSNESGSRESGEKQQNSHARDRNSDNRPRKKNPSMTSFESFESTQKTDVDIAGPAMKGKHARMFSFGLARLSRSFSSKQTSTAPHLTATNTISETCTSDKANDSGRARSTSFRRFLDPLVRPAKTNTPPKEHIFAKKHQPQSNEALLHLTFKDGLPFFKFAADNGNDILAAAVNKLPMPSKGDSSMIYSFCKVTEIKKKTSGWPGLGSKGKCSGLGYNIIGLMKVSSFCENESVSVRESVLYSVDSGPEFLPNRELAAVVTRNRIKKQNTGDDKTSDNIVVILPGGVHGLPREGKPSSLIERWKSGGLCDCGGWDIGCKLRVLTEDEKTTRENQDSVFLFVQRGEGDKKPMLRVSPLKSGLCSVQYDASISLLEAFSTCVTVLTCQKLSHFLELPKEAEVISSVATQKSNKLKDSNTVRGQEPATYIPSPPLSPVARI